MKNFYIPIAIIIASLIISGAVYYSSKNDPLTNCIERLVKSFGDNTPEFIWDATRRCSPKS